MALSFREEAILAYVALGVTEPEALRRAQDLAVRTCEDLDHVWKEDIRYYPSTCARCGVKHLGPPGRQLPR